MRLLFGTGLGLLPIAAISSLTADWSATLGTRLGAEASNALSGWFEVAQARAAFAPFATQNLPPAANQSADRAQDQARRKASRPSRAAQHHRMPMQIRISAARVLQIVSSGLRPAARAVAAHGSRPAGLELYGVSALGTGVRDGDVLTHVEGVPVRSVAQVVAIVISCRGAHRSAVRAVLYRGARAYGLWIEQPYVLPPPASESAQAAAPAKLDRGLVPSQSNLPQQAQQPVWLSLGIPRG